MGEGRRRMRRVLSGDRGAMRHIALLALVSASLVLIVNWNGTVGCGFRDTAAKIPYLADGSNLAC
ncbi:MAG TPA: hypothetical protein VFW71_14325 [Actinomycetota bacterium]|nr:hypothetical protein [Actinomycetota bacterium]